MYIAAIGANVSKALGVDPKSVEELLRGCKELGLDGVQFRPGREVPLDASEEDYQRVRAAASQLGLAIPGTGAGPNLVDPDKAEASIARFELIFKQCRALGGRVVTGEVKAKPDTVSPEEAWATVEANVKQLAVMAEANDVYLAIEPGPNCFIKLPEQLEELLKRVDHPRVGINFDGGNLAMAGADPIKAFEMLKGKIIGVHAKDATMGTKESRGKETALGKGDVDYPALIKGLRQIGFDDAIIIEREVGETVLDDVRNGALLLRRLLG